VSSSATTLLGLLDPTDEGITFPWNVGTYLPVYTASYSRILETTHQDIGLVLETTKRRTKWQPSICFIVIPHIGPVHSAFRLISHPTISFMIVSTGMYIPRTTALSLLLLTQTFSYNRQSVLETVYRKSLDTSLSYNSIHDFVGHIDVSVTITVHQHDGDELWAFCRVRFSALLNPLWCWQTFFIPLEVTCANWQTNSSPTSSRWIIDTRCAVGQIFPLIQRHCIYLWRIC
jgi:hypothetical protein